MPWDQALSSLVAASAAAGGPAIREPRAPVEVPAAAVRWAWPGAELRRALGNRPPTSN